MHPISETLIAWYTSNKRDLPWRNTSDAYKIWLSEVILQQTQVIQGLNYYLKFIEEFPTVTSLANAPEDKVLRFWQGLGYYSRARNLHAAAKYIVAKHKGKFPTTYQEIKLLKGVGDYTAAAIASIAYNLPHAVVDGNVYRVLSRLFNSSTPINSSQGKKEFQLIADELLDEKNAKLHNSAIMEFGALWCKPQNPKCETCQLQQYCLAFQNNTVALLPVKNKTIKIKERFFNYIILNYKNNLYIQKRIQKDIWQNLYEFYLIETDKSILQDELFTYPFFIEEKLQFNISSVTQFKKHILSHQHIYASFYELQLNKPLKLKNLIEIKRSDITTYALPQLINKYLELQ